MAGDKTIGKNRTKKIEKSTTKIKLSDTHLGVMYKNV